MTDTCLNVKNWTCHVEYCGWTSKNKSMQKLLQNITKLLHFQSLFFVGLKPYNFIYHYRTINLVKVMSSS